MSTLGSGTSIPTMHQGELFSDNSLAALVVETTGEIVTHAHDWLEIAMTTSGSGYHITAQGRRPVSAGDFFVLRPGTWHGYTDCRQLVNGYVCIAASALREEVRFLHDISVLKDMLWIRPSEAGTFGIHGARIPEPDVASAAHQIAELGRDISDRPTNRPALLGRLLRLLGTLVDQRAEEVATPEQHSAVAAVLAKLEAHPEHSWDLNQLAGIANLDPAYLSRLFRRHCGLPPISYLARIRAERASALLARTTEPISRIGSLVGWSNPVHFTRRFRALSGLTPTEYRDRCRTGAAGSIPSLFGFQIVNEP